MEKPLIYDSETANTPTVSEQSWIFGIGIIVAVLSYFAKNYVFDPLLNFNRVKGRVHHQLKYYANVFGNDLPAERQAEASKAMRLLSCDLEEAYFGISMRGTLIALKMLPGPNDVNEAARNLVGLSNNTGRADREDRVWETPNKIRERLGIPELK